jgi:hypothetical protein
MAETIIGLKSGDLKASPPLLEVAVGGVDPRVYPTPSA